MLICSFTTGTKQGRYWAIMWHGSKLQWEILSLRVFISRNISQPLLSYLAKHLPSKALISVDDNDTRSVRLKQRQMGGSTYREWHTEWHMTLTTGSDALSDTWHSQQGLTHWLKHDTHYYTCLQHIPTLCHSLAIKCFMPCSHIATHPSVSFNPLPHCPCLLTIPSASHFSPCLTHPSLTSAWSIPAIGSRDKKRNAFTLPIRRSCCRNSRTELNPCMYNLYSSDRHVTMSNYTWMTVV